MQRPRLHHPRGTARAICAPAAATRVASVSQTVAPARSGRRKTSDAVQSDAMPSLVQQLEDMLPPAELPSSSSSGSSWADEVSTEEVSALGTQMTQMLPCSRLTSTPCTACDAGQLPSQQATATPGHASNKTGLTAQIKPAALGIQRAARSSGQALGSTPRSRSPTGPSTSASVAAPTISTEVSHLAVNAQAGPKLLAARRIYLALILSCFSSGDSAWVSTLLHRLPLSRTASSRLRSGVAAASAPSIACSSHASPALAYLPASPKTCCWQAAKPRSSSLWRRTMRTLRRSKRSSGLC